MNPARATVRIARRIFVAIGVGALLVAGRKVWGSGLNLITINREPIRSWPDSSDMEWD